MQADEVEKWKQKIRNNSMMILKDVQKLLTSSKEGDPEKIVETSSNIASNMREIIDDIQDHVFGETETGKIALQTMEQTKKSVIVIMNLCDNLQTSDDTEKILNELKNDCKIVAGNIKLINQHTSSLKASDFIRNQSLPETYDSTHELSKTQDLIKNISVNSETAYRALDLIEKAASEKDQATLVSQAKLLSQQISEMLQHARQYKLDKFGSSAKDSVLEVISVAKLVFQSSEDIKKLHNQVIITIECVKSLEQELKLSIQNHAESKVNRQPSKNEKIHHEHHEHHEHHNTNDENEDFDDDDDDEIDHNPLPSQAVPIPRDAISPKDGIKQLQKEFASRDPEKVFKLQEVLGEGASGIVYKGVHRETKKVVAIKKMQVGVNNVTSTIKEILIMKDLKSSNTLKYYGCYNKDDYVWIIMEYCDAGSLQDIIDMRENENSCLSERQIGQIVSQVVLALEYLHSLKKIHRDVKAGNILLNSQGMVKLADFGISAQQVGDEKRTTTIGSSYWMAPETLMGSGYDSKADIWSLGITTIEMAEGIPPLIEEQPHKAAFRIVNDPPPQLTSPSSWSPQFVDFISHCLTKNPELRPSASQLKTHPFLITYGQGQDQIIELIDWHQKELKKDKKTKKLKKTKQTELEQELNLQVWFENINKTLLLPGHATSEDVCRQCSEMFQITENLNSYALWVVIEDGLKTKEKKLGPYDLPSKLLVTLQKKFKGKKSKNGSSEPFKFVYKKSNK